MFVISKETNSVKRLIEAWSLENMKLLDNALTF